MEEATATDFHWKWKENTRLPWLSCMVCANQSQLCTHTCTHPRAHTRTHTHAYTHTHTQTHTRTSLQPCSLRGRICHPHAACFPLLPSRYLCRALATRRDSCSMFLPVCTSSAQRTGLQRGARVCLRCFLRKPNCRLQRAVGPRACSNCPVHLLLLTMSSLKIKVEPKPMFVGLRRPDVLTACFPC